MTTCFITKSCIRENQIAYLIPLEFSVKLKYGATNEQIATKLFEAFHKVAFNEVCEFLTPTYMPIKVKCLEYGRYELVEENINTKLIEAWPPAKQLENIYHYLSKFNYDRDDDSEKILYVLIHARVYEEIFKFATTGPSYFDGRTALHHLNIDDYTSKIKQFKDFILLSKDESDKNMRLKYSFEHTQLFRLFECFQLYGPWLQYVIYNPTIWDTNEKIDELFTHIMRFDCLIRFMDTVGIAFMPWKVGTTNDPHMALKFLGDITADFAENDDDVFFAEDED